MRTFLVAQTTGAEILSFTIVAIPIRVVVGYSAGGPTNVIAHVLAQEMSQTLGQAVIVEQGGRQRHDRHARSEGAQPDGYALLFSSLGLTVDPILFGDKAGYNLKIDFAPISNAPCCRWSP